MKKIKAIKIEREKLENLAVDLTISLLLLTFGLAVLCSAVYFCFAFWDVIVNGFYI